MKSSFLNLRGQSLTIFVFFLVALGNSQPVWKQLSDFPDARYNAISMVINGRAYVGLGSLAQNGQFANDLYEYNPQTDDWTPKAIFPGGGRYWATSFVINGKGYICLGGDFLQQLHRDLWEYNPTTNTFTQKADFPGEPRYAACAFVVGNKAYVGTGTYNNGNNYFADFWCYDPQTDSWSGISDFGGGPRCVAATFSIGNLGYVGTGLINSGTAANDFWTYNPITDIWTNIQNIPGGERFEAVSFVLGGKGYVGTGNNNNSLNVKSFYCYDTLIHLWQSVPSLPSQCHGRRGAVAFSIGNRAYFTTGFDDPQMLADTWRFGECNQPVANFSYLVQSLSVNFYDSSSSASEWYWDFGDGYYSSLHDPVHAYSQSGKYRVCLGISDSCGSSSYCDSVAVWPNAIDNKKCSKVHVSPIPSSGLITIDLSNDANEKLNCVLIYMTGKEVAHFDIYKNERRKTLDFSNYPDGVYALSILRQAGLYGTRKIVLMK